MLMLMLMQLALCKKIWCSTSMLLREKHVAILLDFLIGAGDA
jgi:hypothetical protein